MAERAGRGSTLIALAALLAAAWFALPEGGDRGRSVSNYDTQAPSPVATPSPADPGSVPAMERLRTNVSGRVVDADGAPASMARVSIRKVEGNGPSGSGGYTDEEGRFSFAALDGSTYVVEVEPDARGSARVEGVAGGTKDLTVRLLPFGRGDLTGTVLGADGAPAGGVQVTARLIEDGTRVSVSRVVPFDGWELCWQTEVRSLLSLEAGAFDFGALPPGRWAAWAGSPGTAWCPDDAVVVEAGRGPGPVELRLRRGSTMRVRLVDGDGKPRPGVQVVLRDLDPLGAPAPTFDIVAVTGADGRLEVHGLPPGPWNAWDHEARPRITWTVEEQPEGADPVDLAPAR